MLKEETIKERTPTMKLSKGLKNYFETHRSKNRSKKNTAIPTFFNRRTLRHVTSFLGLRHTPLEVDDVIK